MHNPYANVTQSYPNHNKPCKYGHVKQILGSSSGPLRGSKSGD